MSVTISISSAELSRFNKGMDKYSKTAQSGVANQVKVSAVNVQRYAVDNIRDTGIKDTRKSYKYDANLARSIRIKSVASGFGAQIFTRLFYAIFREKGTVAHKIRPKNKQALAFNMPTALSIKGRKTAKSDKIIVKSVNHPGTKAAPFMEPAAKREQPLFIKSISEILRKA